MIVALIALIIYLLAGVMSHLEGLKMRGSFGYRVLCLAWEFAVFVLIAKAIF